MTRAVDVYAAQFVKCCDAGQVVYPDPCPFHGTTDRMYIRLADDPELERMARWKAEQARSNVVPQEER